MRKRLHFIVLCFFALLIVIFSNPTISAAILPGTYYVDIDNGEDGNDGTSSGTGAWKTLHYASGQINGGDAGTYILNVAAGTYSVATEGSDSALTIDQDNVTIQGAGPGTTIIDGTSAASWTTGIKIEASTGNVTIKDLDMKDFSNEGIAIYDGTGNIIEGCKVYENGIGILIYSGASTSDNIIRNNEIYHNRDFEGIIIDGSDGNEIYLNSLYDNWYVEGGPGIGIEIIDGAGSNLIHDNNIYWSGNTDYEQGTGIKIYNAGSGNKIYQNEIHDHEGTDYYGIYVANSSPEIRQNEIHDNYTGIYVYGESGTASPSIWNNLIYGTTGTMENGIEVLAYATGGFASPTIYHNTIDGGSLKGIYISQDVEPVTPDIKYNIITNFDQYGIYNDGGNPTIDYNDVWNNSSEDYYGYSAGPNDISQDPLYASYQLQSGSPCIDAIPTGDPPNDPVTEDLEGNTRPQGAGYDMGAYEILQYTLTVSVSPTGGGSVTGTGINCPGDCTEDYISGTGVTLTATAASDWVFSGWSVDLTGSTNPATITVDSNKAVTATFVASDSDGDGMLDTWENTHFGDLTHDGTADGDSDGLTDLQEYQNSTDPNHPDSDGDGYSDSEEVGWDPVTDPNDSGVKPQYSPGIYYASADNPLWGDGTQSNPWNLHTAINHINGGTSGSYIVNVALGTYSVGSGESDGALTITQDKVTVIGESGSMPTLDGTDASMWGYGIGIYQNADSVRIYNLEISNFLTAGLIIEGTGSSVKNCNIHDNGTGIWIESTASSATIKDNQIHENGTGYDSIGVWVRGASGVTVGGNQIYTHEYYGIGVESCSPTIQRNEIYGNDWSGIDIWGYTQEASPQIRNNLIYSGGSGITMSSGSGNTNPPIYHNTIDGGTDSGIYCHGTGAAPDIKYNIISNFDYYGIYNDDSDPGSPTIDYNDVYNNTGGNYIGCSPGTNDISQDPLYASYKLQSTSPCIDQIPTGDPVTMDFPGYLRPRDGGYDMGAYEFVSDITQDYSLPGGSGDATDYRIFTVPVELETGSALKAQMENALGTYDKGLWRVFAWNVSTSSYIEMDDPAFATLSVYPGMAFWIISTSTDTISFSGQPALDGSYVKLSLSSGWHMIALPWPAASIELDNIAASDGINNYGITSASNSLTQQYVWEYTGTGPDSGYEQLASGSTLEPGKGYWIKVEADSAVNLLVPKDNTGGYFEASSRGVGRSSTGTDGDEEPPPPPGISVSFTSNPSDGATLSAEGSCFIATAAYGSGFHPYVKRLRGFRDAYLLGNAPGRKLVALYYRYSPPVAEVIADNAPLKYLTRLLLLPLIGLSAFMLYANPIFGFVGFMGFVGSIGFVWLKR